MPSDSHQDQWSSQWHQWHSSNPMMCTRPMPIMSYLGCCGTCHSLRRTCNTYTLHCQDSNCKPHLHDWHANVQARMLTPLDHLPLFLPLPLPFFLASSFLVPDSNVCTTTKNNNAYNADTTSDAIQASTWWAEFNLVHKVVEIHGGSWYSFLQFLSIGEPLLCLNKLNKSTSALRTQQTTTPILDKHTLAMQTSSANWCISEVTSASSASMSWLLASNALTLSWSCGFVNLLLALLFVGSLFNPRGFWNCGILPYFFKW